MGKSNKIYLNLDDLNKLYGISPAMIRAIKKKKRMRRNKKINNGQMGSTKPSSEHMVGTSSRIADIANNLSQAKIQQHIDDVTKQNRLTIEPDKPAPVISKWASTVARLDDGSLIAKQNKNGTITVVDATIRPRKYTKKQSFVDLNDNIGNIIHKGDSDNFLKGGVRQVIPLKKALSAKKREKGKTEYNDYHSDDGLGFEHTILHNQPSYASPTATLQATDGNSMIRNPPDDTSGFVGSTKVGTSSDGFEIEDPVDGVPNAGDSVLPPIDNTEHKDNTDQHFDINTPYKPFAYSEYTYEDLIQCANDNNIDIYTKQDKDGNDIIGYKQKALYNLLKGFQLV